MRSLLFGTPAIVLLVLFVLGPIIMTFYFSFTNLALTGAAASNTQFIGFENFIRMFQDPSFKSSVIKTIIFLISSAVIGQQVVGFLVAYLMKQKARPFRRIIGILVLAGWITPEVVVAFVWFAFLSDQGTLNTILGMAGMEPVAWLLNFPLVSVIFVNIWHGAAFSMLMYQAALDDIPQEVEEASRIDGANAWQRLWRVTLPIIKGAAVTNMVLVTLQTLGVFTLIYALTGGGPGEKTTTLPIFMYNEAFVNYQLGYGTAISLVLLLIGIILSLIYIRFLKTD
ncbi:carbohydrate ABC transporter permease [Virgibacillus siamensis]|uniref:carbohydrate ABC transporter permease n=1 Tax=Virgibacillus siamensis TaxID=480071 RepID=UPI000987265C|nr:sugar ABC transporter permease [Virgibacillus siamensis]